MGAVTNRLAGGTASTNNVTSYPSASFTPVAGEVLFVSCQATGTVASAPTLAASANGLTFTRLPTIARKNTNVDTQWWFVSNEFVPASPSAMTVTFNCPQDAATGCIISVAGVSGLTKTGSAAVRQMAGNSNIAGGTAPSATFSSACLATNPVLFAAFTTVTTGRTPPSGFTEQVDATYSTPATGGGYSSIDSGFTGTVVSSTDNTSGACCALALEIDASGLETFSGWGMIPL